MNWGKNWKLFDFFEDNESFIYQEIDQYDNFNVIFLEIEMNRERFDNIVDQNLFFEGSRV